MQNNEQAMQEAMRIAKTSAGQQLLHLLKNSDHDALNRAMNYASSGNIGEAKQILSQLLSGDEAQRLLKQLGEANHG